ncbi:MAG: nucleoside:proton symporter [Okeania sp. SIO2C2]|uniref:NupC/NupG family nucleoside CNT transporter n=1 Tax=Okeania sp. SIO2C2 TaxID=2607787 RepID=UPI0013BE4133|nr:nucleoside transporter C-terminal domain-containing protein [Okeania sp. SIO2C2]NEP86649.1 nucleoside:proton symporter [Okeania sp. SIO2C2]
MNLLLNFISLIGIVILCFIAWLGSENRLIIPWKVIFWGIGLQLFIGLLIFVLPTRDLIAQINNLLNTLLDASEAGARFLFGGSNSVIVPDPNRIVGPGPAARWIVRTVGTPYVEIPGDRLTPDNLNLGFIFAFRSLPQIIFFSGLISLLYRLNIIQPIVQLFAKIFQKTMKISGAESLSGAANIFVGIESAIAVKPYLQDMTRSELCTILSCCFGSIASSILGIYAVILRPTFPGITGHLVSASIMTIPACFVLSKLLIPETEKPKTLGHVPSEKKKENDQLPNPMDSLMNGGIDGVKMAVGIVAVIIVILGLLALVNAIFNGLANLPSPLGNIFQIITVQNILGAIFLPLTFLTGVSLEWSELWQVSILIGRRLFETSIPPYFTLAQLKAAGEISDRGLLIVSYVLCGFTHVASYGIFVGGISNLIPSRRSELSALGWKALWVGTLATLMTGCVAGLFDFGDPTILGFR